MKIPYKATINIDKKLWDEYKNYCRDGLGLSISERIRDLIAKDLKGRVVLTLETDTLSELGQLSPAAIDQLKTVFFNRIEERLTALENASNGFLAPEPKTVMASEKLYTDVEISCNFGLNVEQVELWRENRLVPSSYKEAFKNYKPNKYGWEYSPNRETEIKTDKVEEVSKGSDKPQLPKIYTNREVGEIEGLTAISVSRYRTGARQPQDSSFWERWAKHSTEKGWLKT